MTLCILAVPKPPFCQIKFKISVKVATQQAKNIGPIWAPDGSLYGSYMGNPYGTDVGFATGIHLGPIWAHPYGNHMGPIWAHIEFPI